MSVHADHAHLVARLKKPGENILECVTSHSLDLLHMAIGVVGEVLELCEAEELFDATHVLEELGDIHFYVEGMRQALSVDWTPKYDDAAITASRDSLQSRQRLLIAASKLLDLIKRYAIYAKRPLPLDEVTDTLQDIVTHTAARASRAGHDLETILEHNCRKLNVRYGTGKYSDSQAQQRADKTPAAV